MSEGLGGSGGISHTQYLLNSMEHFMIHHFWNYLIAKKRKKIYGVIIFEMFLMCFSIFQCNDVQKLFFMFF